MSTIEPAPLNSRSWWEDYFTRQWDECGGRDQTTYFMRRLIESLPPAEHEYLASQQVSVLDWGCAFGNGVDVLGKAFPRCRPVGADFAERAVAERGGSSRNTSSSTPRMGRFPASSTWSSPRTASNTSTIRCD